MSGKLNSEFNYRYLVEGNTPWERIKILKGFLVGRKRAAALEQVAALKRRARIAEIEYAKTTGLPEHEVLRLEAEHIEAESHEADMAESFALVPQEIASIEKLLAELYTIVEPNRLPGYSDEDMFEVNATNEFTVMMAKEIQAEIIANGRPSPATLRNAMRNQHTLAALKNAGLIPQETILIGGNNDPLRIEVKPVPADIWYAGESDQLLSCCSDNRTET